MLWIVMDLMDHGTWYRSAAPNLGHRVLHLQSWVQLQKAESVGFRTSDDTKNGGQRGWQSMSHSNITRFQRGTGWSKQIGHWPISVCAWTILATCCFSRRIPCFMDGLQVAHVSWSSCFLGSQKNRLNKRMMINEGVPVLEDLWKT